VALLAEDHPDVTALLASLGARDDADVDVEAEERAAALEEVQRAAALAQQELGSARAELHRLEGASDANVLAARAAEALARLAESAERYVVVDLQRRLLREQLEGFATRRANPLLEEAGALLAELTDGRWTGVGATDDGGARRLLVRRGDGADVPADEGLSEGTADQVFLALRLAAVAHQHRARRAAGGPGLPVVLDD
ncbi:ATP-binding protein, partial [Kineococcus glutinatus]|uniref:ATP-binding protein n=1 Tax=Kineococcus glutinatus TaxID=1070872 RepID=UPI003CD0657D